MSCFYCFLDVLLCMLQNEPFTSYMPEALFNISRFLMNETKDVHPKGVSQFAVLYTLSKQARNLGAYKLARQVLEKMQCLRVPPRFKVRHQIINLGGVVP